MTGLSGKKLGFLGAGMMAEAIIRGLISQGKMTKEQIVVFDPYEPRGKYMADELGVKVVTSNAEVAKCVDVIIVAVKPHFVQTALKDVGEQAKNKLIVSIAAGVMLKALKAELPSEARVVRVMPNTPCLVSASASAFAPDASATHDDIILVEELFGSVGIALQVPEWQLDAVTGLSGSGPAYVFMFIEALADGGVRNGLARDTAKKLAAQTVLGAAKMVLDNNNKHPGELRNNVESPGGTTIAGTHTLEKGGFRAAVIDAVCAATNRSKELGQ